MAEPHYETYTDLESGIDFTFKTDPADPEMLHIFARHLTTVDEAIQAFFDPAGQTEWNDRFRRFETRTRTHILYWYWRREGQEVMVVTCMTRED